MTNRISHLLPADPLERWRVANTDFEFVQAVERIGGLTYEEAVELAELQTEAAEVMKAARRELGCKEV